MDFLAERLRRGLSQAAIAEEIGIGEGVWKRVERTGKMPHPGNARQIADYFAREVTDLWPVEEPVLA